MTDAAAAGLRVLIADTVREVVAELVTDSVRDALATSHGGAAPTSDAVAGNHAARFSASQVSAVGPVESASQRTRVQAVRVNDDRDLEAFARHLLDLFENPKNRQDLRAGRYRFTLTASPGHAAGATAPSRRVDRGAVTERQINAAAEAGERIVVGRRAVLTPLARERARSLGVEIEKER